MLYTKSKKNYRYVEVAKYIPRLERVIRLMVGSDDNRRPEMWDIHDIENFRDKHKNLGLYTSVFHFGSKDMSDAARYGSLYFDFDSESIEEAQQDTRKVYDYFTDFLDPSQIRLYFTGSKGFHIEAEAGALGIDPSVELDVFFRFIAENINRELETPTMDFAVYDKRRMWRLKESQHQSTGLYKNEIPRKSLDASVAKIQDYCKKRRPYTPPPVSFSVEANRWFKDQVSEYELKEEERREYLAEKRAQLFNKYGTSLLGEHSDAFVRASWKRSIETLREAKEGSRNRLLSVQSYRLFLTLLEAGRDPDEAIEPLREVAQEIGLEMHESKATIESALNGARDKHQNDPERILTL